jgi:hypothetical protein
MAYQPVDIGSAPNDGTGDPIRDAFDKVNDNFVEVYAGLTGLLDFKGSTDCSANPNYPAASKGDFYLVSVAGKIGGASGIVVTAGDTYFALADNAGGTQAGVGTSWTVIQGNVAYVPVNQAGDTMTGDLIVPDEAYNATNWDGNLEVPTKNAVRDKIEAIIAGGGSFTAASTTEQLTGTDSAKGSTSDSVAALWEQGSDVASSGTISIGEGGYFNITGTTTITDIDFATDKAGRKAWVKFAGILTLTHNGSTLILPTGANITTAAGDTACFVSEGSDAVRCVSYNRASGAAVAGGGGSYTDEEAQDAVGTILVNNDSVVFTYADGTPSITAFAKHWDHMWNYGDGASAGAQATKGLKITPQKNITVDGVSTQLVTQVNAASYVAYICSLTSASVINTILGTSATITGSGTARRLALFEFATPVALTAGTTYAVMISRTDNVGSFVLPLPSTTTALRYVNAPVQNDGYMAFTSLPLANGATAAAHGTTPDGYLAGLRWRLT